MIVIFEIDSKWCGIGIEWNEFIKGIRLGYVAVHFVKQTLDAFIKCAYEVNTKNKVYQEER